MEENNQLISQAHTSKDSRIYPELIIYNNEHPNRLLAIPFIGFIIRLILIIPPVMVSLFLGIWVFILWLLTPFVILFTGKYWEIAYTYSLKNLRYSIKIGLYIFGVTDKYPDFNFDESGIFTLRYDKPNKPSRLLAFPILGFLIRIILLVPYLIYIVVLSRGALVGLFCTWFVILFKGRYPESIYEFISDTFRASTAFTLYILYLSDTYPSFHIKMSHKAVKIILLILGLLLLFANFFLPLIYQHPHLLYHYNTPAQDYGNYRH